MLSKRRVAKTDSEEDYGSLSKSRLYFALFLILAMSGAVFFRLYGLAVLANDDYRKIADQQHKSKKKILPARGEIFLHDKDGIFPVAANRELMTAFAVPVEIENRDLAAWEVSNALGLEKSEVLAKISKEGDMYKVLKRKLSDEEAEKIRNLKMKGVNLEGEYWRYYPGGSLASHIIGFLGFKENDFEGMYGIERQFEKELRGDIGMLEQERDTLGRWISIGSKTITPAQNGSNIVLAIDHVIQFKAETALRKAVERHSADGGKVVIIEPYSGKILAMASAPDFNLNNYSSTEDIGVFRNPVVSDSFECGSIFKPFTMAAGIDSGKIEPNTTYVDTGQVQEAGFTIRNSDKKSYGTQTMTNVIEKSLNTGVIFVEKQVGNQQFFRYLKDFGFGKKTGIDLPHETAGNLSNLETNRNIEYFTASFGQGIAVTPLQLIMAYGAIANGGQLMTPLIVDYSENHLGERKESEPFAVRTVISKGTSNKLKLMLESNVTNGHGKLAGVPGYRVAGKTGTAQIPDKTKKGYLEDATTGSFAGFGPIENPIFAMVVIIDYPKDVKWAESTAAPLFGEIAKFIFDYYGIEPTEEYTQEELVHFTKTHNYLSGELEENFIPASQEESQQEKPQKDEKETKKKKKQ